MNDAPRKIGDSQRRYPRYEIEKDVRAVIAEDEYQGTLKDISGGGASVRFDAGLGEGSVVDLDIEDIGSFQGEVVRKKDDGRLIAVKFDIEQEEMDKLVAIIAIDFD